jgi:adenosine/AMP kinase
MLLSPSPVAPSAAFEESVFVSEVDWLTRAIVTETPKSRMAVGMRKERVFMMLESACRESL